MSHSLFLVDAFSDGPFTGNPAGVVPLEAPADEAWMQRVAMEMNQAETAFVRPIDGDFELRWFTPTTEVDLCGHATLATAHILFARGMANGTVSFHTKSGILTASQFGDEIEMDFPAEPPVESALPHEVVSLGAKPTWAGKNRMDWFVELPSAEQVRAISPDFSEIAALRMRGLIVTARDAFGEHDFVSRCFFPQSGVPEDPVTGSAHCALAAYWSNRLGRDALIGYQASMRGGVVKVELSGDRVRLRGRAVTTLEGSLLV